MENLFKVSAHSYAGNIAGVIAKSIRADRHVVLQAIGAGAVNQAVEALAIARVYLVGDGIDIVCVPTFVELSIDGVARAAVQLHVDRPGRPMPTASPILPPALPQLPLDGR